MLIPATYKYGFGPKAPNLWLPACTHSFRKVGRDTRNNSPLDIATVSATVVFRDTALSGTWGHQARHMPARFLGERRQHVTVRIQSDRDRRMAEKVLYDFWVHMLSEQMSGRSVT